MPRKAVSKPQRVLYMAQRDPAYQPYPPAIDDEKEYELIGPPEDHEPYEEDEDDEEE